MDISIITVTYNSEKTVTECLESVRNQNVKMQHIIIDGNSNDNTLDIIDKFNDSSNTIVVSEPDGGVYEAMNKGLQVASGEIIGILNSDDMYADNQVLADVITLFENSDIGACYGDLIYVDRFQVEKVKRLWRSGKYNYNKWYWGWMPPHPTFFVRRSFYQRFGGFDLSFGSAADYELMLRFIMKNRIHISYIPRVLVKMRQGGISNISLKNRIVANRMDRLAWEKNELTPYPWTILFKPLRKLCQWIVVGDRHLIRDC